MKPMTSIGAAVWRRALRAGVALAGLLLLSGCVTVQVFPTSSSRAITLKPGDLEAHGIAFITPSTATGREEEKQAVAFLFAEAMSQQRGGVRVVPLSETLSAINRADLTDDYKRMYDDYRDTGLFKRDILGKVGRVTNARYIGQIKLQEYFEGAKERFGFLGFRIVETRYARVRLFFQIWNAADGAIAWEGIEEVLYANERVSEQPVTFQKAVSQSAQQLIGRLP